MTSSATSTAGFIGTHKTLPALGGKTRAEPASDGEKQPDNGFGAAFEAIRQYSREAAGKTLPDNPVETSTGNWSQPDRDYPTWAPQGNDVDAPLAAGDLLLAGGALTPEGDESGFDARLAPEPAQDQPPEGDSDEAVIVAEPLMAAAAIQAAVTVKPTMGVKPAVAGSPATNTMSDEASEPDAPELRPSTDNGTRVVREAPPVAPSRPDPFEGLRNLVHAADRQSSPEKPLAVPSYATLDPEGAAIRSPEPSPVDRLTGNPPATDRQNQAIVRDAGPAPSVNLTVVEARQFPAIAPSQTGAAAVVSAISSNESWNAMLRNGEAISATPLSRPGVPLNTLTIQLRPAELGSVNAVLRLSGDQLVVELKVETIEAYRQLSESQNAVVKALKGQGYAIEQISIQQVVPDRPVPPQGVVAGQGNGQSAGGAHSQQGQDNLTQSDGGRSGQDNGHEDGFENEGRGPVDLPGGNSSRPGADGAVYL